MPLPLLRYLCFQFGCCRRLLPLFLLVALLALVSILGGRISASPLSWNSLSWTAFVRMTLRHLLYIKKKKKREHCLNLNCLSDLALGKRGFHYFHGIKEDSSGECFHLIAPSCSVCGTDWMETFKIVDEFHLSFKLKNILIKQATYSDVFLHFKCFCWVHPPKWSLMILFLDIEPP